MISLKLLKNIVDIIPDSGMWIWENQWTYNKMSYYDDYDEYEDEYAGTYAHDVEGFSDDDIDTIFDGDPDAYWNID